MPTQKITTRAVDAVRAQVKRSDKPMFVWDTELKGFGLYATPVGRVSWLVQKWQGGRDGRQKRVVIAHSPPIELEQARALAAQALGDVAKGVDIVDRKTKEREAKRAAIHAMTLADAVDQYIKRNEVSGAYWADVRRKMDRDVIPQLGKETKVASITKQEVRALIEAKEDEGLRGAARYTYVVLRPFFKWCLERDIVHRSWYSSSGNLMRAPPPPSTTGIPLPGHSGNHRDGARLHAGLSTREYRSHILGPRSPMWLLATPR